jgi:hypothetical protein
MRKVFGSTTISFLIHLGGALTCASCWAVFGPALALLFGSGVNAAMGALLPYAPISIAISGVGLVYSVAQLVRKREQSRELPFRMATAFTALSVVGWVASASFVAVTLVKG